MVEMMRFGFKTLLQVVLPSTKTKGNILSTLFIFFVGTIERISCLKNYLTAIPFVKSKQVKQLVLLAGLVLFLLSLAEHSPSQHEDSIALISSTSLTSKQLKPAETVPKKELVENSLPFSISHLPSFTATVRSKSFLLLKVKPFVFIHSFRI